MLFQKTMRRADRQTALMRGMFGQLGIDVERLAPHLLELGRIVRTCMSCRNGRACGAWLRSGGRWGDRHDFCLNAARFDALRDATGGQA
jgi:hypothetical protein